MNGDAWGREGVLLGRNFTMSSEKRRRQEREGRKNSAEFGNQFSAKLVHSCRKNTPTDKRGRPEAVGGGWRRLEAGGGDWRRLEEAKEDSRQLEAARGGGWRRLEAVEGS